MKPPLVEIAVRRADPAADPVLVVAGEVDLSTAPQLRRAILELLTGPLPQRIWIDLAEVSLLDSTGVFVLIEGYQRAKALGVALTVQHPRPIVRRVLEICGLLELLTAGRCPDTG